LLDRSEPPILITLPSFPKSATKLPFLPSSRFLAETKPQDPGHF
jgi:hypothetical protein